MRRLAALLAACAMVAASLPASAVARATPTHESFSFPFEFSGSNPCSGENVVFSGRFSGEVTTFRDASGGVHFTAHQLLTAQGKGDLGNRYTFSDTLNTSVHFDSDSAPFILTQTLVDHVIAQGDAPNFILHTTIHITINANGEVTASAFESKAECR
jgi:hypothetical protein